MIKKLTREMLLTTFCFACIAIFLFTGNICGYELGFAAGYYKPALSGLQVSTLGVTGDESIIQKNMSKPNIFTVNITVSNTFSRVYNLNLLFGYFQLNREFSINGIMKREEMIRVPCVEIFTGYSFKWKKLAIIPGVGVVAYFPIIAISEEHSFIGSNDQERYTDFNLGNLIGINLSYIMTSRLKLHTSIKHRLCRLEHSEKVNNQNHILYEYNFNGFHALFGISYQFKFKRTN